MTTNKEFLQTPYVKISLEAIRARWFRIFDRVNDMPKGHENYPGKTVTKAEVLNSLLLSIGSPTTRAEALALFHHLDQSLSDEVFDRLPPPCSQTDCQISDKILGFSLQYDQHSRGHIPYKLVYNPNEQLFEVSCYEHDFKDVEYYVSGVLAGTVSDQNACFFDLELFCETTDPYDLKQYYYCAMLDDHEVIFNVPPDLFLRSKHEIDAWIHTEQSHYNEWIQFYRSNAEQNNALRDSVQIIVDKEIEHRGRLPLCQPHQIHPNGPDNPPPTMRVNIRFIHVSNRIDANDGRHKFVCGYDIDYNWHTHSDTFYQIDAEDIVLNLSLIVLEYRAHINKHLSLHETVNPFDIMIDPVYAHYLRDLTPNDVYLHVQNQREDHNGTARWVTVKGDLLTPKKKHRVRLKNSRLEGRFEIANGILWDWNRLVLGSDLSEIATSSLKHKPLSSVVDHNIPGLEASIITSVSRNKSKLRIKFNLPMQRIGDYFDQ